MGQLAQREIDDVEPRDDSVRIFVETIQRAQEIRGAGMRPDEERDRFSLSTACPRTHIPNPIADRKHAGGLLDKMLKRSFRKDFLQAINVVAKRLEIQLSRVDL